MNLLRKNDLIMLGLSLVIFAILQVLITTKVLTSFWELNLIIIGINVIMAVSLNLINGYTGQFSLGHAGFMAVGAYTGVVMTTFFHLPFIVAIVAGAVLAGLLGFLICLPNPCLRGGFLGFSTFGVGGIFPAVVFDLGFLGGDGGF